MTDTRKAHLENAWAEVQRRQVSNAENIDRALLTLSSTGLAVSFAVIKNIVPFDTATHFGILLGSWGLFAVSIFATLASFLTSQCGLKTQLTSIKKELLEKPKDPTLEKKADRMFSLTTGLTVLSCVCYFAAILLTILFISINQKEIF